MMAGQTVCHKLLTALLLHPEYIISSEKMTVTAARSVTRGRIQHEDLPHKTLTRCWFTVGPPSMTLDQR